MRPAAWPGLAATCDPGGDDGAHGERSMTPGGRRSREMTTAIVTSARHRQPTFSPGQHAHPGVPPADLTAQRGSITRPHPAPRRISTTWISDPETRLPRGRQRHRRRTTTDEPPPTNHSAGTGRRPRRTLHGPPGTAFPRDDNRNCHIGPIPTTQVVTSPTRPPRHTTPPHHRPPAPHAHPDTPHPRHTTDHPAPHAHPDTPHHRHTTAPPAHHTTAPPHHQPNTPTPARHTTGTPHHRTTGTPRPPAGTPASIGVCSHPGRDSSTGDARPPTS